MKTKHGLVTRAPRERGGEKILKSKIGSQRMTRYERSRIVGARALQVSMGAPILIRIDPTILDPIRIAELELQKRVLPITVRRKLPSGVYIDVALSDLED
ncbi:MAG: DNA-directed RNA polymerase subunit K [Promethearchaeota archaeon]